MNDPTTLTLWILGTVVLLVAAAALNEGIYRIHTAWERWRSRRALDNSELWKLRDRRQEKSRAE